MTRAESKVSNDRFVSYYSQKSRTRAVYSSFARFFMILRHCLLTLLLGFNSTDFIEKSLQEYKILSQLNPNNVLEICMKKPSDIWGHLGTLYMLTIEYGLKNVLELGTAEGESTIALLQAASQIGGSVTSIDINPCREAWNTIKNSGLFDWWNFIQGDDLCVNWVKSIDHLFIDTSHSYLHTLRELQKFEPYVRTGGIITLHDVISCPEVMSAIAEYMKNRGDLRLYRFLHNNGLAIIFKGQSTKTSLVKTVVLE